LGSPTPTITQQWTLDAVDISGATGSTYTPVSGDVTHLLRVREIATNSVGSANSTSAPQTVAAGATDNWSTRSAGNIIWADRLDGTLPVVTDTSTAVGAYILNDPLVGNVSRDTTVSHGTALASVKFAVLNTDNANSGNVGINFSSVTTIGDGDVIWGSYLVRAPRAFAFQSWPKSSGDAGNKLSIMSYHGSSSVGNEFVVQMDYNGGLLEAYAQDGLGGFVPYDQPAVTNCSSTDFRWQNLVDHGANPLTGTDPETGSAWSSCAQDRARYGGLYSAKSLGQYQPGLGDPLSGGFRLYPDEWVCITFRVARGISGTATSRYMVWAERASGGGYTKLIDTGAIVKQGVYNNYDNLWLLPYVTNRIAGGNHVSSRTSNITGATILAVGNGTPTGNGTLEYVSSTGLFRWHGNGESFGSSRGFSNANGILRINVTSAGDSYVVLEIAPGSLPSGTVTDTVTIASGRPDTQINYNDAIVSRYPIIAPSGGLPLGVSKIGDIAAAMAPGTWAQVTSTGQDSVLGGQTGVSGSAVNFCTYFPWNPIARRIEIMGQDHTTPGALPQLYARFNDTTGTFAVAALDDGLHGGTPEHGYGHTQVNPYTGDIFHYPAFNHTNSVIPMWTCTLGNTTLVHQTDVSSGDSQVALGSCWWSGPFTGRTLGAQGAYMLFNSGASNPISQNGEIAIYDPTVPGWLSTLTSVTPSGYASCYNSVMAYSPKKNVALYGGGNGNTTLAYRLNSDGTHTAMPSVPASGMGLESGIICSDPVTGNFLLLSAGQLWELNPTGSGTWTQQTGSRAPPAGVNNPTQAGGSVSWCSIPDYGVVAAISQLTGTGGTMYLYKHA
jgi:hypothetical protein